jgi:hypothetical protein
LYILSMLQKDTSPFFQSLADDGKVTVRLNGHIYRS